MKNILLGYSDEHGKGPARILSNTDKPVTETAAMLASIKAGSWPKGIVRAELITDERGRVNLAIKPEQAPELNQPESTTTTTQP